MFILVLINLLFIYLLGIHVPCSSSYFLPAHSAIILKNDMSSLLSPLPSEKMTVLMPKSILILTQKLEDHCRYPPKSILILTQKHEDHCRYPPKSILILTQKLEDHCRYPLRYADFLNMFP